MEKLVSIIIPAFNAERWLEQTIKSALAQTWKRKEIIIVDDGSIDGTAFIAKKYESDVVKIIKQMNGGVSKARNTGLTYAQGDFIQWLDADDLLDKNKVKKQMDVISEEGSNIAATGQFGSFIYHIERAKCKPTAIWSNQKPLDWLFLRFDQNVWMASHAWLISRELTDLAGPWDERLCLDEDGEYFCRIVSKSVSVKYIGEAISYYRVGNSRSLCMNRTRVALESMLLSMELSFKHIRSLEDSDRTKNACLNFLQNRYMLFYPDDPGIKRKMKAMAAELGGILEMPHAGLKISIVKNMIGWRAAIYLRNASYKIKAFMNREIERIRC